MKAPRKLRRDAVLKKLDGPARAQVRAWVEQDGEASARQRLCSELGIRSPQGGPISTKTLYAALAYWRAQEAVDEAFAFRDAQIELMRQFRPGDDMVARQWGEFMLLQRANQTHDKDTFAVAAMAADSRRRISLEETKARARVEIEQARHAQRERAHELALARFQASMRTKIEAAMQALAEQARQNPALDAKLREALALLPPQA